MSSLVFNCSPYQNRVALVEEARTVEVLVEERRDASLVGNIYKGRVTRILPGMQAAFVDVGLERAAFLYVETSPCHTPRMKLRRPSLKPGQMRFKNQSSI